MIALPQEPAWVMADHPASIARLPVERPTETSLRTISFAELRTHRYEPPKRASIGVPLVGNYVQAGSPKVGKTTIETQRGVAISSERVFEFLGEPVISGPVLFVIEEGSLEGLSWRIRRQAEFYGVGEVDLQIEIAHRQRMRLDDRGMVRRLRDHVRNLRPVLVVLDPLNRLHQQDENKPTAMTPVMDAMTDLAIEFSCAVGAIHHLSKPSMDRKGTVWDRFRGASSIRSATDANLALDNARGGIRLQGEFRDAEPLDAWLVFDRDALVFEAAGRPEAPIKIPPDELLAFVTERTKVTVAEVMERFVVARNTARAALDALGLDHYEGSRGALIYVPGKVERPVND